MLLRLYDPQEGAVLWDGVDIRSFDRKSFRQHVTSTYPPNNGYEQVHIDMQIGVRVHVSICHNLCGHLSPCPMYTYILCVC